MTSKNLLREEKLRLMQDLMPKTNQQQVIDLKLQSLAEYGGAQKIGCYYAKEYEFSLNFLIGKVWEQQKIVFLPIVNTTKILQFGLYTEKTKLKNNKFGIKEPITDQIVGASTLDLIVVPVIGFDRRGARLGHGGGYYDATLANCSPKPFLVALAYSWQEVSLIAKAHELHLDCIITEKDVFLL